MEEQKRQQLSREGAFVRRCIRAIENEIDELDLLVLRTPTGQVREDLTAGLIMLRQGVQHLLNVC